MLRGSREMRAPAEYKLPHAGDPLHVTYEFDLIEYAERILRDPERALQLPLATLERGPPNPAEFAIELKRNNNSPQRLTA